MFNVDALKNIDLVELMSLIFSGNITFYDAPPFQLGP